MWNNAMAGGGGQPMFHEMPPAMQPAGYPPFVPDNTEIVSEWLATKEQFKTSANRGYTHSALSNFSQMSQLTRRSAVSVNGAHSTLTFHPPVAQQAEAEGGRGIDALIDVLKEEINVKFAACPEVLPLTHTVIASELTTNAQRVTIGALFWEGIAKFERADLSAPSTRLLVCELVQVFVHLCHWPHPEVSSGCRNVFKRNAEARKVVELACVMISTPLPNNDPLYRPFFIRLLAMSSEPFLDVRLNTPLHSAHPALLAGMLQELSVVCNPQTPIQLLHFGMLAKYLRLEGWAFETITDEGVMRALPSLLHVFVNVCMLCRMASKEALPQWKGQQVYLEAIVRMIPRLTCQLMRTSRLQPQFLETNTVQMLLKAHLLDLSTETGATANEYVIRTFAELRDSIPRLPWETLSPMLNFILNALPFLIQPKDTSSNTVKKRAVMVTGAAARFFAYAVVLPPEWFLMPQGHDPNSCLFPKILKLTEAWAYNAMERPKREHLQTLCSFLDTISGVVSRENPRLNHAIQIMNTSQEGWFIFSIGILGSVPGFPMQTYAPKMLNVLFLCIENNTWPQFVADPERNIAFIVLQFIAAHFNPQTNNRQAKKQLPDTAVPLAPSLDMAVTIVQKFLRDGQYREAIEKQLVNTVNKWDPLSIHGCVNHDGLFRTILRFIYDCLEACPMLRVHWSRKNDRNVWMQTLQSRDQEFRDLANRIDQLLGQGQVAGILPFAMQDDYAAQPWS
ncbi:hypothetical protein M3Y99_00998200 [Aphelenchoides fujianensis]|nr:hypothetical protein M3Y99_00998200 [Aphelenchoides fujianensis]